MKKNQFLAIPSAKRILAILTIGVSIIALAGLVSPNKELKTDEIMHGIPFYQVIKEHDPALFHKIKDDIDIAVKNEEDVMVLKARVRSYLDQVLISRIPLTSNEAMVAYVRVTLKEMQALNERGYGLCYRFIYPKNQPLDISKYVSQETLQEDMTALTEVVRSSYENPGAIPNVEKVSENLSTIYVNLTQVNQDAITILSNPQSPRINKDRVCEMTIALYEKILELPADESGDILRFMAIQNARMQNQ